MEPRFGADFGGVRIHAGAESASLNRQISAQAFTHAQDIYMGEGRYAPGTTAGNRLLAHELAHVVQQTGGARLPRTSHQSAPAGLVQRDGGKKFTGEIPRTGEDSEEYTRFLQANPDMLSDKERPFAKFLVSSKKPERGPKPPTGAEQRRLCEVPARQSRPALREGEDLLQGLHRPGRAREAQARRGGVGAA